MAVDKHFLFIPPQHLSELILNNIVQNIHSAVILHDRQLKVIFLNDTFEVIFQMEKEKALGKSPAEFLPDTDKQTRRAIVNRLRTTLITGSRSPIHEFRYITPAGRLRYLRAFSVPLITNNEITHVMSLIDDLTDQKQLEREVIKYTKISSIADIAYTLAHEINNPLTGIKLGLSTLYKSLQKEENIQVLDSVMKDLNRIQKTVRAFLIAKKEQFRLRKEKIGIIEQIITDVIFHLSGQLNLQDVSVQKVFSAEDLSILIDRDRMYQVFLNVLLNAVQAISENGNIEIRTEVTTLNNSIASDRRFLKISLSDDGSGIDPEEKQDVFRPFYSSKPGGTGLGLSICKDIVSAHKGAIQIESEKNKGTTLNIYIPITSE